MSKLTLDFDKYVQTAREAVAEGQVLLKNENMVLPLQENTEVAVFGRIQFHYYKSGTGSGGMVNVDKVTGILDALQESEKVTVNETLLKAYQEWEKEHPFDAGIGWGNEPWCQVEMPVEEALAEKVAKETDTAIIIIGRTAGEDQDNLNHPGSYLLTETEEEMLAVVRRHFAKMIVVLNVGNIIDMSFEDTYKPDAVLYAWQGGMIGGYGTVDILTGETSPSGKLTDTIAYAVEDYPSDANFGNLDRDFYEEDIYVGYRYFETGAKEKVRYPFGFGLSYTTFSIEPTAFEKDEDKVVISCVVTNTGAYKGKEVVQVYASLPQGKLGKPFKNLAGFAKTKELLPGESETVAVTVPLYTIASYDETGLAGFASSYVLEAGEYTFFAGNSVRDEREAGSFVLTETKQLAKLSQALAPVLKFKRIKPVISADGSVTFEKEEVPLREKDPAVKRIEALPEEIPYTGDMGHQLSDVKNGNVSMEEFIAQLSDEDLSCIIRGEGMGSPKVTPGTASAFGGVSEKLKNFGIPCGCCSDGPSGMRLDSGMKAFSLPNGTLLASSFNEALVENLYEFTGIEMVKNKVDTLLGPGMNIHRHPLNGRNFEYFSEDPLLTGKVAAAMVRGMQRAGVTGTAKHFCGNNQELCRNKIDSVISERALREIYLKGFEIVVKEGHEDSIMTTYGAVNGLWTAGSYDLNTTILREEWGFDGIVMTDWWAKINDEGGEATITNYAAMAKAQNDLYMVCADGAKNCAGDNTLESLAAGTLTRGELQRNAMNICKFLLHTYALDRMMGIKAEVEVIGNDEAAAQENEEVIYYKVDRETEISLEHIETGKDATYLFALDLEHLGGYKVELTAKSDLGELAQLPATLFFQGIPTAVFTFQGTDGKWDSIQKKILLHNKYSVLKLYFAQNGLQAKSIKFMFDKSINEIPDFDAYVRG